MFPLYEVDGTSTCPLGFPMSQNRLAVPTWSYAMEKRRPARVIELGTAGGGLTSALGIHAWNIGAKMITYDLGRVNESYRSLWRVLGIQERTVDVFKAEAEIGKLVSSPGVTFLLCDAGDKPRELATFAKYLKSGDVIAGHDYDAVHELDPSVPMNDRPWQWCELRLHDGQKVALEHGLVPFMQEHFDLAGWLAYQKP